MKPIVYCACSDLGTHISGDELGPVQLVNDIKSFYTNEIYESKRDESIIKSRNLSDRRKNEYEIDKYNSNIYQELLQLKQDDNNFIITIGGDDTITIPSALADKEKYKDVGLLYFTGASLFDTFETTQNGNLKDLTIASIVGYKNDAMRYYHPEAYQAARCVIIGIRNITDQQKDNLRYAGIEYITAQQIKENGIEEIVEKAFENANYKTKGIHICVSMSFIDPEYAPGVSEPVFDGLDETVFTSIHELFVKHINEIIAYDLVDFNPLRDVDRKTEQIAVNALAQMVNAAQYKDKDAVTDKMY